LTILTAITVTGPGVQSRKLKFDGRADRGKQGEKMTILIVGSEVHRRHGKNRGDRRTGTRVKAARKVLVRAYGKGKMGAPGKSTRSNTEKEILV